MMTRKPMLLRCFELRFGRPIQEGGDILRVLRKRLRRAVGIIDLRRRSAACGMAILWPGK